MKKRLYLSIMLGALLVAAVVAIVVATGKSDLGVAREKTERYQRMDLVLADGFTPLFECISDPVAGAMGVHYIQSDRFDGRLELSEPEALVFEPQADGRRELVAIEYIIPAAAWSESEPPTFLGQTLQYKTMVGPHEVDPYYELHAWVWEDNPSGMFADWNPDVACPASIPATTGLFPEHSAGDLPPRDSVSRDSVYDSATTGLFPEHSAGDLPPRDSVGGGGVYDSADGGGTFSGDDAYDPAAAAAGLPIVLSAGDGPPSAGYSGDDAYDPAAAAAGLPIVLSVDDGPSSAGYSGDDPYDAAAGGLGEPGGGSDLTVSGILESMGGQCSVDDYAPEGAC